MPKQWRPTKFAARRCAYGPRLWGCPRSDFRSKFEATARLGRTTGFRRDNRICTVFLTGKSLISATLLSQIQRQLDQISHAASIVCDVVAATEPTRRICNGFPIGVQGVGHLPNRRRTARQQGCPLRGETQSDRWWDGSENVQAKRMIGTTTRLSAPRTAPTPKSRVRRWRMRRTPPLINAPPGLR